MERVDTTCLDVDEAIDAASIAEQRDRYAAGFRSARPFRHVVVDGFLRAERARELEACFPRTENFARSLTQKRCQQRDCGTLPSCFQRLYAELRAPRFVAWLESVTRVFDLEPDRREQIEIGLIESGNGGYHNLHADPNMHPERDTFRRITVLVYLNEIWRPEWGGSLELWSSDAKRVIGRVEPSFNRCLIMENHDQAYHGYRNGHTPPGVTRKAMALVYFAKTPGEGQSRKRHGTIFRLRPNESFERRAEHALFSLRCAAKAARDALLTPPR